MYKLYMNVIYNNLITFDKSHIKPVISGSTNNFIENEYKQM